MTIHLATIRYGSQAFQSELAESLGRPQFEDLVANLFREHNWGDADLVGLQVLLGVSPAKPEIPTLKSAWRKSPAKANRNRRMVECAILANTLIQSLKAAD
jgi:hypothetical protein